MGKVHTFHGATTKLLPAFLMFLAFVYISDYTRESVLDIINPEVAYVVTVIVLTALIWLYEGFYLLAFNRQKKIGSFGSYFFFFLCGINALFATVIFMEWYNPFTDTGDINLFLQVVLFFDFAMLLFAGIYEIRATRHFEPRNPLDVMLR